MSFGFVGQTRRARGVSMPWLLFRVEDRMLVLTPTEARDLGEALGEELEKKRDQP